MLKIMKPVVIIPDKVVTPQCCEPVDPPTQNQMWRRDRYKKLRPDYDPDRCQRPSSIEINGKFYCRLHAAHIALEKWIVGDLVETK